MKSTALWALIILNAVLLASFVWRLVPEQTAVAQQAVRRTADYIMIPAEVNGASQGILIVVDQTNSLLSAKSYDESNHQFANMAKIDLRRIFGGAGGATPARRGATGAAGGGAGGQ